MMATVIPADIAAGTVRPDDRIGPRASPSGRGLVRVALVPLPLGEAGRRPGEGAARNVRGMPPPCLDGCRKQGRGTLTPALSQREREKKISHPSQGDSGPLGTPVGSKNLIGLMNRLWFRAYLFVGVVFRGLPFAFAENLQEGAPP